MGASVRYTHNLVDVSTLPHERGSPFHRDYRILWIEGEDLLGGGRMWVPCELVHTDFTRPLPTGSGCFPASSNGLAGGNHLAEATSHVIRVDLTHPVFQVPVVKVVIPKEVRFAFQNTDLWEYSTRGRGVLTVRGATGTKVTHDELLEEARLQGEPYHLWRDRALTRLLLDERAGQRGRRLPRSYGAKEAEWLRARRGLSDDRAFRRWLDHFGAEHHMTSLVRYGFALRRIRRCQLAGPDRSVERTATPMGPSGARSWAIEPGQEPGAYPGRSKQDRQRAPRLNDSGASRGDRPRENVTSVR